jgi:hypothetical protein
MDSSKAAAPAENTYYNNSDIRAELQKIAAQKIAAKKISAPAQTEMGRSQINDDTPSSHVENNIEGIRSTIARLSSNSVDGLERLTSELQELQKLLMLEVERVQSEISSALAGIQGITNVIAPWKRNTSASQSASTNASNVHADSPTSSNGGTAPEISV